MYNNHNMLKQIATNLIVFYSLCKVDAQKSDGGKRRKEHEPKIKGKVNKRRQVKKEILRSEVREHSLPLYRPMDSQAIRLMLYHFPVKTKEALTSWNFISSSPPVLVDSLQVLGRATHYILKPLHY